MIDEQSLALSGRAAHLALLREFRGESPEVWALKVSEFPHGGVEVTAFQPFKGKGKQYPDPKPEKTQEEKDTRSRRIAVGRAKRTVRQLVRMMEADHLLTLTYRENMLDAERARTDWDAFRRLMLLDNPEWRYVVVIEHQDRGSLHFHAAVKGRQDVNKIRACWYKVVGEAQGQIDVAGPSKRWGTKASTWNTGKLSSYMTKYLQKDFDSHAKNKKQYWRSRNIELPVPTYYWLGATNLPDALAETWDYVHAYIGVKHSSMFVSEDWSLIWIDAAGPARS